MLDSVMVSMIKKVRALAEDLPQNSFEVFQYSNSNVFTLAEAHVSAISMTTVNGSALQSGEGISFDFTQNTNVTVSGVDFNAGDIVKFDYGYTKYSDTEIMEYIRGALVWLSINDYGVESYNLRADGIIVPAPAGKTDDLICIIASILLKPNYIHYRMPNLAINYPNKMTQEEKIQAIISKFKWGTGVVEIIQWNRSPGL